MYMMLGFLHLCLVSIGNTKNSGKRLGLLPQFWVLVQVCKRGETRPRWLSVDVTPHCVCLDI